MICTCSVGIGWIVVTVSSSWFILRFQLIVFLTINFYYTFSSKLHLEKQQLQQNKNRVSLKRILSAQFPAIPFTTRWPCLTLIFRDTSNPVLISNEIYSFTRVKVHWRMNTNWEWLRIRLYEKYLRNMKFQNGNENREDFIIQNSMGLVLNWR